MVNISTTQTIKNPERIPEMPQFPPGSPFEDFFKEFLERQGRPDVPPKRATSLGSGFIIDAGGYVVTNNHVIADADEITVTLHDDTTHKATLVGRDSKTDLAVLKIEPGKKPLVRCRSAIPIRRIGDWVLAIGNRWFGTVTAGIVSARARDINAALMTTSSRPTPRSTGVPGGPLFNGAGEVIGINTAIFAVGRSTARFRHPGVAGLPATTT